MSVTIPPTVKAIGGSAFSGCASLASITIPASVKEIGEAAFLDCPSLKDVRYRGTKDKWRNLKRGAFIFSATGAKLVHCSDGDLSAILD